MDWTYKLHVIGGFAAATPDGITDFAEEDTQNNISVSNMGTILEEIYMHHHD